MVRKIRKELEELEFEANEAEDKLEEAFVAWVKANNDYKEASPSAFDGMPITELLSRILYMVQHQTSGIYDSELVERFHIVELRPDGTFEPVQKQIVLKFAFE